MGISTKTKEKKKGNTHVASSALPQRQLAGYTKVSRGWGRGGGGRGGRGGIVKAVSFSWTTVTILTGRWGFHPPPPKKKRKKRVTLMLLVLLCLNVVSLATPKKKKKKEKKGNTHVASSTLPQRCLAGYTKVSGEGEWEGGGGGGGNCGSCLHFLNCFYNFHSWVLLGSLGWVGRGGGGGTTVEAISIS